MKTTQLTFDLSFSPEKRDTEKKKVAATPEILRVRELTQKIKRLLEGGIGQVWVQGEISNYRKQASGHHYFTLKDESSVLGCVFFAGDARFLKQSLRDGMEVQVAGEISVYEARGNYQLIVRHLQTRGEGALQVRFEALKQRLQAEGLFAAERKRPLPKFPLRVGVVTSPTGAALQDFLNVLWRRNPHIEVILNPVRVQGVGAAKEIAKAIEELQELSSLALDAIVVTRGGGSLEDLWEFNEEEVARAIVASRVPVVSAVGHEIDFTISDFAADVRAATPSAAAELLAAESSQLLLSLVNAHRRMLRVCRERHASSEALLRRLSVVPIFRYPERSLRDFFLEMDAKTEALLAAAERGMEEVQKRIEQRRAALKSLHPARWTLAQEEKLQGFSRRILLAAKQFHLTAHQKISHAEQVLKAFDPRATLARGFTATFDKEGRLLKSAEDARRSGTLTTHFADGQTVSEVVSAPKVSTP